MSILSNTFKRFKDYILVNGNYVLSSRWTKSDAVVMGDGTDDTNTLEKNLGSINGITDSLTATSSNVALSATAGKSLQDQITTVNSNLSSLYYMKSEVDAKLLLSLADNCYIIYSTTANDTATIGSRSCKRVSSEPCIWLYTSNNRTYYGWLCIGSTETAVTLTSMSNYGGSSDPIKFGSTSLYYSTMNSRMRSDDLVVNCNGTSHTISIDHAFICEESVYSFDDLFAYGLTVGNK